MAKLTISMPDAMEQYVAERVDSGQYGNVSEYFRDLVRQEREKQEAIAALRERLDRAEASGISKRKVPEIMADVEARMRANGEL
jgi:antitoxin ParD1/3/4